MRSYLDFEKPVAELDSKVDELRALAATGSDINDEISRLEEKSAQALGDLYANLTPWQKTLVARHPQRPHFSDFVGALITEFTPLAGGPQVRRGRGAGRRLRPLPRREHLRDGPGKGRQHRIPHQAQFRHGASRGLPQGGSPDGDGRPVRHPRALDRRFRRRLSRHRRGRARTGRGNRAFHRCLPFAWRAQCGDHHRRRHVGRCNRNYHGQPRPDVGACDLQRDLAGSGFPRSCGATAPRPRKRPPT